MVLGKGKMLWLGGQGWILLVSGRPPPSSLLPLARFGVLGEASLTQSRALSTSIPGGSETVWNAFTFRFCTAGPSRLASLGVAVLLANVGGILSDKMLWLGCCGEGKGVKPILIVLMSLFLLIILVFRSFAAAAGCLPAVALLLAIFCPTL